MAPPADPDVVVRSLRNEIDELREHIRQLEEALCPRVEYPASWCLTPQESRLLAALMAARGTMSKDRLLFAMNGPEAEVEIKMVDVIVCRLRRKVPAGIVIETRWGNGYVVSAAGRTLLRAACEEVRGQAEASSDRKAA